MMTSGGAPAREFKSVLPPMDPRRCVYCGTFGYARDHFRPWVHFREPYWLPSCAGCNSSHGDRVHSTLGERCLDLAGRLRTRNSSLLAVDWADREDGLEGQLLAAVHVERVRAEGVQMRLDWARDMGQCTGSILLQNLRPRSPEVDRIVELLRRMSEDDSARAMEDRRPA